MTGPTLYRAVEITGGILLIPFALFITIEFFILATKALNYFAKRRDFYRWSKTFKVPSLPGLNWFQWVVGFFTIQLVPIALMLTVSSPTPLHSCIFAATILVFFIRESTHFLCRRNGETWWRVILRRDHSIKVTEETGMWCWDPYNLVRITHRCQSELAILPDCVCGAGAYGPCQAHDPSYGKPVHVPFYATFAEERPSPEAVCAYLRCYGQLTPDRTRKEAEAIMAANTPTAMVEGYRNSAAPLVTFTLGKPTPVNK